MTVRVTYIAIAMGGLCGAFAALVGSSAPPTPSSEPLPAPMGNLPMRPIAELSRPAASARPAASSEALRVSLPPTVSASASPSANPGTSADPSASAAATAALSVSVATSASSAPAPAVAADTTPLPATKEALLRAEMRCDNKNAAACILAARSYEAGSPSPADPEKATKYRKIALNFWISQCDHNSPTACATLADMYRAGSGVPQSERNADALVQRTRELCHFNDVPVCHTLPPAH